MSIWILSIAAVCLCALALLPGSMGVLKFTHGIAARSRGAYFIYSFVVPLYLLGAALACVAAVLAYQQESHALVVLAAIVSIFGISVFGFLMHTSLIFRPVRKPEHVSPEEAVKRFGPEKEVIGVLDQKGKPFAFIAELQMRPHIVYETDNESPFISTHCLLAHSSMAYEATGAFQKPEICVSSVVANNLVFYEKGRGLSVQQIQNEAAEGQSMKTLPTVMTSLGSWTALHPDSKVWVRHWGWRDRFFSVLLRLAPVAEIDTPDLMYSLKHPVDERLPLKTHVNGVRIGEHAKAFPSSVFEQQQVVEDLIGGEPIVFLGDPEGDFVQLYSRAIGENSAAHFQLDGTNQFKDFETGSIWDLKGYCIEGPLKGRQLEAIPHYSKIFWFCWADFFPATEIYGSK